VLAAKNRLTSRDQFARVTRSSIKSFTPSLVGYLSVEENLTAPKIGFVVSRAIGGSVTRHKVQRQLRHASRDAMGLLPQSSLVVVRATKKQQNPQIEIPQLFQSLNTAALKKAAR
jgi:ribonuclease P protein component